MNYNLRIEKLIYGGDGAGFLDGLPVFVPMTVPGDEIECQITKKHKGYAEGRVIKLRLSSPNRTTPKCEHFGRCGGCQWQHMDYAIQILWKQLVLEEQLVRIGKLKKPYVMPTIPSPKAWNYRGRVKLHRDKEGRAGFYAAGTNELVEVKNCLLADDSCLEESGNDEGFTQVNPQQNENLKALVCEIAKELGAGHVLELYCGGGNLTFPLADAVKKIFAADSDRKAIGLAKTLQQKNSVNNIDFFCLSAKVMSKTFAAGHDKADTLLVDPPRDGCLEIIGEILKIAPKNIIYVSCNPSTLARDIKAMVEKGYRLKSSQPIDMFPQTFHIESVSVLTR